MVYESTRYLWKICSTALTKRSTLFLKPFLQSIIFLPYSFYPFYIFYFFYLFYSFCSFRPFYWFYFFSLLYLIYFFYPFYPFYSIFSDLLIFQSFIFRLPLLRLDRNNRRQPMFGVLKKLFLENNKLWCSYVKNVFLVVVF